MLSIIIPTLDEEKYLPFLLASIKKQDFRNYEIIVADAGSRDRTLEIARKYGSKIVPGGLPAKGRNNGAKAAKGELFLFLDAEAVLPQGFLKRLLLEFKQRKLDIGSCSLESITKNKVYRLLHDILYNWPAGLLEDVFPYASNFILVKREVHQKIAGFDEAIALGEDHAYARKAAKIAEFGFLRSSKLTLSLRRFQNEGWLTISAKYYFCNLYNIFFGDLKSDIFKYSLKRRKEKKEKSKIQRVIFTILKSPLYIVWFLVGFVTWPVIFLIFIPKLTAAYLKKRKK